MEKITKDNLKGHVDIRKFAESMREGKVDEVMTTSDFGHMADVIDRSVMLGYTTNAMPSTYGILGYRYDTVSFESASSYRLSRVKTVPRVPEKGKYLPNDIDEEKFTMATYKYGEQFDISWEAWLRDGKDLSMIQDLMLSMQAWGSSVEYTKEKLFTELWAQNATLFANSHNGIDGNALANSDNLLAATPLTEGNFSLALAALKTFDDPQGNIAPYAGPVYLVVPATLEATARRIINSAQTVTGSDVVIGSYNPAFNAATVIVPPFLEAESSSDWYLFADPRIRPLVRYGYVMGEEEPKVWVKSSDAQSIISGVDNPFEGSFDSDDIEFKLRFTFGINELDWRGAVRCVAT